jgi:hypothetical protein
LTLFSLFRQFALEVDITLNMSIGGVSNVLSPSHAAIGFTRTDDKSGKIILNSQTPCLDVDLVLIVTMKDTLETLLPACYIEKINDGNSSFDLKFLFYYFIWMIN